MIILLIEELIKILIDNKLIEYLKFSTISVVNVINDLFIFEFDDDINIGCK